MKAVFVGRFQPFHRGHRYVVEHYRDNFDDFCIVVGSAETQGTEDNPLSFKERKKIIEACYPDMEVIGISDEEKDDEGNRKWIKKIEKKSNADKIISKNPLVNDIVREFSEMELVEQDLHDPKVYSGTAVRRRIKSGEEWRYLVPSCAEDLIGKNLDRIKSSGIEYDFEPGWTKKNAYHDTVDSED